MRQRLPLYCTLLLIMAACQKESETVTLELTIEQTETNDKTYNYYNGSHNYACWNPQGAIDDSVYVNNAKYKVSTPADDAESGYATINDVASNNDGYYVVYPAAWVNNGTATSSTSLTIPQNEIYCQRTIANKPYQTFTIPMADYAYDVSLEMHPYCGVLAIPVTGNGYIEYIQLQSASAISGPAALSISDGSASLTVTGNTADNKIRRLTDIHTALSNSPQTFYLAIPAISSVKCTLTIGWRSTADGITTSYQRIIESASIPQGRVMALGTLAFDGNAPTGYTIATPDGSEYNPYVISSSNWSTLTTYANNNKYFVLSEDITVSGNTIDTFNGTLDGNGHTLTLSKPLISDCRGTIKNLTTSGAITISSDDVAGSIAYNAKSGHHIFNCTNECQVTFTNNQSDSKVGGIVGYAENGNIEYCTNRASVTSKYGNVGGIVGYTKEPIRNCTNEGSVTISSNTSYNHKIGGIVGKAENNIENCHNTGVITNNTNNADYNVYVGGIVGYYDYISTSYTLINCSNRGNINSYSRSQVGGITGYAGNTSIINCFAVCSINVSVDGSSGAGIVAETINNNTIVKNCYFNGSISAYWWAGICRFNNGLIQYCYSPSPIVKRNGSQVSDTISLTNATTLSNNADLATTLNANLSTLNIARARHWTVSNGIVCFE